jgi:hypothetical protein
MKTKRNVVVHQHFIHLVLVFLLVFAQFVPAANKKKTNPEQLIMKWHKMTFSFDGPQTSETADPNPFLYYRTDVTFTHPATNTTFVVPGYYAADGKAANTSASEGSKWLVHFAPNQTGQWNYQVSFRQGDNIAVSDDRNAGQNAGFCDGQKGSFTVAASDKTGRDFRGKGILQYVGKHHLQFADSKEFFLKAGADAPENLLSYADFDGDFKTDGQKDNLVKTWQPHVADWKAGDPTWSDGKGKGLIGAINYLASKGMNVFSFLTMNIEGDDRNVFPYITYKERVRLDVSRLAQWEVIFEHADKLGMYLHFKTQETENDQLLDKGELGTERKLYYRELIARFGHHLALNWNLGEENTNTPEQMRSFAKFFKDNDPYHHPVVLHTFPGDKKKVYTPLVGPFKSIQEIGSDLTGVSLQSDPKQVPNDTRTWVKQSAEAGRPWVVANDEQGSADAGVVPDANDATHDEIRKNVLWGNITGGGAGVELYFGYKFANSDLSCQDFRSRDIMWDQCRYALTFFSDHKVPFQDMTCMDSLVSNNNWCLAKPGQVYVVYLKNGGNAQLDLEGYKADYIVKWYNPRAGGKLLDGSVKTIQAAGKNDLGTAPADADKDWVILVGTQDGAAVASTVAVKKETPDQTIVLSAIGNFDNIAVEGFVPTYQRQRQRRPGH